MIVFVDGVDGSGKTTLIDRLLDDLATQQQPAVLAPPLWTFLEPISTPDEFAPWVQTTSGTEIARHLLRAMSRRLDKIRTDIALGITSRDSVVLVDRGAKTIICSAQAHAATGHQLDPLDNHVSDGLTEQQDSLEDQLRRLASTTNVTSVELRLGRTPDLILERLRRLETLTPPYVRYLRSFCREMAASSAWRSIPRLDLLASDDLGTNAAKALAWIEHLLRAARDAERGGWHRAARGWGPRSAHDAGGGV